MDVVFVAFLVHVSLFLFIANDDVVVVVVVLNDVVDISFAISVAAALAVTVHEAALCVAVI